jgi:carbon monoxide dehydrogenase subunit G
MRLEKSIVIRKPIEEVFAFVTDMDKVKSWLPVKNVQKLSDGPMGVGSTFSATAELMGKQFPGKIQVTQYEPSRLFSFKVIDGPAPVTNTITFTSVPEGTNLTTVGDVELTGVMKLSSSFMMPMIRKQLDTQISNLKNAVEAA